jgi:hypothetical protein
MLDGVGVVRSSFFKELLAQVCRRSHLMLAAVYDCRGVPRVGATCFLVDVTVVIGLSCSLLAALLAPLLAAQSVITGILDGDVGRCSPATAWGQAKLGHLVANDVLGGDASPLLDGALEGFSRC